MLLILVYIILIIGYFPSTPVRQNLALRKTAWESNKNNRRVPESAVDGSRQTNIYTVNQSCTHSTKHDYPWWIVDLGAMFLIESVIVVNRGDCCGFRLHNFTVEVGELYPVNNTFSGFHLCFYYPDAALNGEVLEFNCSNDVIGRYVKIQIYDVSSILTLCEVEVYGVPYNETDTEIYSTSHPTAAPPNTTAVELSSEVILTNWLTTSDDNGEDLTTDRGSGGIMTVSDRSTHTDDASHISGSDSFTTSSTTTPTESKPTTALRPLFTRCRCQKKQPRNLVAYTIEQMKINLNLDRNATSRYKRRFECQSDKRTSSKLIGITGTLVLITIFSVLLLLDIMTIPCGSRNPVGKTLKRTDKQIQKDNLK